MGVLSSKVKLLDATQLEQVEGRLHALSQRLTKVVENKEAAEEADKTAKVRFRKFFGVSVFNIS